MQRRRAVGRRCGVSGTQSEAKGPTPSEHTDAAWQLGHELMQPMPEGWGRSLYELRNGDWEVVTTHAKHFNNDGITNRADYIANAKTTTLTEAHRLCREQAWAKHRKNTGGS